MNKTITIYELLGLIKDGKAPKKIKYNDYIMEYVSGCQDYEPYKEKYLFEYLFTSEDTNWFINNEVEVIDEEEFIEIEDFSKIAFYGYEAILERVNQLIHNQKIIIEKMKEKE